MSVLPTTRPAHPDQTHRNRPRRAGSLRRQRDASRAFHLGTAVVLLVFVYGPAGLTSEMQPWMRWVFVPLLTATGIFLWKQAQIRRLLTTVRRRVSRSSAAAGAAPAAGI